MDTPNEPEIGQIEMLAQVFQEQLVACLEECARGRPGLFSGYEHLGEGGGDQAWPEAARLRELAVALQGMFSQGQESNPLCDEFLDLCSMHGESNPGERKLARAFLDRIGKGAVGTKPLEERKPW
jgi:hypothetical protein